MPLVRQPVNNLLGGVSQQAPAVRGPDQCQRMINAWPSPVFGITKRQPTKWIRKFTETPPTTPRYHIIDRSPTERYLVVCQASSVQVYTLVDISVSGSPFKSAGEALTLQDPGAVGYGYLSTSTTAFDALRINNVADYTFILNTQKVAAMDTGTITTARPYASEFYIFVRQGNYKSNYTINLTINGTNYSVTTKTWDGNPNSVTGSSSTPSPTNTELDSLKTDDIAEELRLRLLAIPGLFAGGSSTVSNVLRDGSVLKVFHTTFTTTKVETNDSAGDTTLSAIWKEVPRVAGYLPEICSHGFKMKVVGAEDIAQDDYFVKFIADAGSGFGKGHWQEDLDYSQEYQFDASTMPHALVRVFDDGTNTALGLANTTPGHYTGTINAPFFAWIRPAWDAKLTGNTVINPRPSFVGRKIQNLVFYKERFGFLSDDRVVLSETHHPLNFWRTTMLTLEDSAPIDIIINHSPVALCKSGIAYNENLLLKSGKNQFIFRGGDILSPRTVQVTPVSRYENYENLEPIAAGRSIFFGFQRGDYSGVREFYQLGDQETYDSADITSHVPNYVAGTIEWMTLSSLEETLLVKGSTNANILYVYKYMWNGQQKILNSWGYWEFDYGCQVRYAQFADNILYLINEYADGLHLETVNVATGYIDTGATFVTHLDRRIDNTQVSSEVYSGITGRTTITLPYAIPLLVGAEHTMILVQKLTGTIYTPISNTTSTIVVTGDVTALDYWIGHSYGETYGLTKPIVKIPSGRGLIPDTGATQRVKALEFEYSDSGWAVVYVTVGGRSAVVYYIGIDPFTNGAVIYSSAITGKTDKARIPIHGRADELTIEITNPYPYPFNITSAIWEIMYYEAGQRLN